MSAFDNEVTIPMTGTLISSEEVRLCNYFDVKNLKDSESLAK